MSIFPFSPSIVSNSFKLYPNFIFQILNHMNYLFKTVSEDHIIPNATEIDSLGDVLPPAQESIKLRRSERQEEKRKRLDQIALGKPVKATIKRKNPKCTSC